MGWAEERGDAVQCGNAYGTNDVVTVGSLSPGTMAQTRLESGMSIAARRALSC
jgi:hypothetical protein